jgi:hypothetical protein
MKNLLIASAAALLAVTVIATATAGTPASTPARAPVVGGETFVKHDVVDQAQESMVALWVSLPASWQFRSKIAWYYDCAQYPVSNAIEGQNPANAEAYFLYPALQMQFIQIPAAYQQYNKNSSKPGQHMCPGNDPAPIYLQPLPPVQIMSLFIRQVRGNVPNLRWLGQQSLPGLAKALGAADAANRPGVGVKISYDLGGKPVEEAFYGLYYKASTQAGPMVQTNWGLDHLHSFRAPAGTLDKRMKVFAAIEKSVRVNPDWSQRAGVIVQKLNQAVDQKIKEGYDQLAAAQRITQQVMANEKAFNESIDRQIQANRQSGASSSGGSSGRSVFDKADDLVRGVDTTEDPMWGTSQHSNLEQYHWTDGYGNYRDSNDANYNPNQSESTSNWQLMPEAK